jgi:TolA-binding protein
MRIARSAAVRLIVLLVVASYATVACAQSFRRGGTEFNAVRSVTVPAGKSYAIIVTEFLHQGEIRPDGRNVLVVAQNKELVPMRILQLGPGDFCRLAFQPIAGQSEYDIFYGGDSPTEKPPQWTSRDGLLLETRQFKNCDLRSLESVRSTFDKAAPIGADYVDGVFNSYNPFSLTAEPFLSRYSGELSIRQPGVYGFMVSSQDCSFLLVDGKLVAFAPGMHGPVHRAFRGLRHDVKLAAGLHKFEYYHAAAGPSAMMVAAWEPNPTSDKPQSPTTIPSEVFRTHAVGRLPANRLTLRTAKQVPDFVAKLISDVPLPDNEVPLVGVMLRDVSPKALSMQGAKLQWDFGDGQTSDMASADHVYLRPGLYAVTLSVRRGGKTVETTNRIYVDRPHLGPGEKQYSFDDYLRIVETYDPQKLDAASLRQMVLALEAKSLTLANRAEDAGNRARAAEDDPNRRRGAPKDTARTAASSNSVSASDRYLADAVAAGKTAFVGASQSAAKGDDDLLKLAQLVGPMARDRLGDSETAFDVWRGAARRIAASGAKAQCEIAAADITVNDLLKPADAKALLEAATKRLGTSDSGPVAANLQRVWGDYYAATGDGKSARKAYLEAERLSGSARPLIETTATRGAHARSTEEFVKQKLFARAAEEIQAWQREFPTEKMEGYLTLLCARYWAGRGKYAQAIAQAEQLQAVSPDSPYIDQLLLLAADSEMRRGRKDRALATLHSLLKDYPGSPLAPLAKRNIETLEGDGK